MSNIYAMVDTWNSAGTTFTAIKMNVTDTASAAGSLLMDLQIAGSSVFSFAKGGAFTCNNASIQLGGAGTGLLMVNNTFTIGFGGSLDTWISRTGAGIIGIGTATGNALGGFAPQVKAGAFVAGDFPSGSWMVGRDTSGATTKLYYNNGGVLQAVALA